jgi:iron complex transport system ATP-binding protein
MVVLNVNGVECCYGSVRILEDVTLSVEAGDFFGILGPNGSGKTTLLKSISRTLKPILGTIMLDKSDIYTLKSSDLAKELAVVPQESTFGFSFSALDVVLMGRNPHMKRFQMESVTDLSIAKKAMALTNTWHLADRPINELSGGEKQRVIIARALAQEPKVLLLDEPLTHLDIINQLEIMDIIKNLCLNEKILVLAVFHDFNLAARYCNKAVLIKKGQVYSAGTLPEVLTSENIKAVFKVDAIIKKHLVTNSIFIIPLSPQKAASPRKCAIHLICGAGTGTSFMKVLLDEGYSLTAGVLNVLDTDFETAQFLTIPVITEAPFSVITEKNYSANMDMIRQASKVILTSVPFGYGNLKNLECALEALEIGLPVYLIEEVPIENRDFTKGKATVMFNQLKNNGALLVKNQSELLSLLNVPEEKLVTKNDKGKMIAHLKAQASSGK